MSEQTRHLVEALRQRLNATLRRITLAELAFGVLLMLGILAVLWGIAVAVEAGFWLEPGPRSVLSGLVLTAALGLAAWYLLRPLLRWTGLLHGLTEEGVAHRIGERFPEVSDRLVNLLHLSTGRHSDTPSPLLDRAVQLLGEQVTPVPFEQVEDFARARRISRWVAVPVLGLLAFLVAAPSTFLGASERLLHPTAQFERPGPFRFLVAPGDATVVRGASLHLRLHTEGRLVPQVATLLLQQDGEALVEEVDLLPDSTGAFTYTLDNVRQGFRYRASADGVASIWYTVTVVERPAVAQLQVALAPPAYTRLAPQRLEPNVGDVTGLPGTRVSLDLALTETPVAEAFLQFDDSTRIPLTLEDERVRGDFTLRRNGHYQVHLRSVQGIWNEAPITYLLKTLNDAFPTIVLLEPEGTADLNEALQTPVRVRIGDDYGFQQLRLYYRLAESRFAAPSPTFASLPLALPDRYALDQEIAHTWLLRTQTNLDLVPGDVVEYYLAVWDNDAVAGFKTATTPVFRLRMPSLAEQYEQLEQQQDATETNLEELLDEARQAREQFEELQEELRQKQEADWEDQRQLEQLQQRQEQMQEQAEDLVEQVERMTEQMRENDLVSPQTLEMFQELQRVVEEINTPELMEALRQLEQALQQLNLQQMQESLQEFQFNEEQYQQRLERTLELFKQLRMQQELEEAARRAEELARQEAQLREETRRLEEQQDGQQRQDSTGQNPQQNPNPQRQEPRSGEELARQQEMTREEMEALEQQLREMQQRMEELRRAPQQQMQQVQEQLQQQQMPQQMQQNADQLRQQDLQPAQQGQQQLQQQLQQLQQQLQQMQQSMGGQQQQINAAGLRRALSDILTLSQKQEDLRDETQNLANESPGLRDFARQQSELSDGLRVVSDSLQQLARNIPQMTREVQQRAGESLREMAASTDALVERSSRRAIGHQKGAMTHLNELALLLTDLLNQMMNASGSSSGSPSMQQMLQQLQQMGQQQQQLNQQIQQLLNDMQGNRLSQDAQQRLNQLARQQEEIRRQLQQLGRNRALRNQALGDLNRIAEQMEETIRELQQRQISRQTVRRQQQILTRLLEATRSLQQRGQENRRESRTGTEQPQTSPDELPPNERAERLRRDLLRALDAGYAPDYEELIRRYFELLQQQPSRQR
jgi:hypothetical protein